MADGSVNIDDLQTTKYLTALAWELYDHGHSKEFILTKVTVEVNRYQYYPEMSEDQKVTFIKDLVSKVIKNYPH